MEALSMGVYGPYVWACFIMTAMVFVICEWRARVHHRDVYSDVAERVRALGEKQ